MLFNQVEALAGDTKKKHRACECGFSSSGLGESEL